MGGLLLAVDLESGDERWRFSTPTFVYSSPLVLGDGLRGRGDDDRFIVFGTHRNPGSITVGKVGWWVDGDGGRIGWWVGLV